MAGSGSSSSMTGVTVDCPGGAYWNSWSSGSPVNRKYPLARSSSLGRVLIQARNRRRFNGPGSLIVVAMGWKAAWGEAVDRRGSPKTTFVGVDGLAAV